MTYKPKTRAIPKLEVSEISTVALRLYLAAFSPVFLCRRHSAPIETPSLSPNAEILTQKHQVSVPTPSPRSKSKDSDSFWSLCTLCCICFNTVYTVVCVTYASHGRSFMFSTSVTGKLSKPVFTF